MTAAATGRNGSLPLQLQGPGSSWVPGNTDNFLVLASTDHSQISKFLQTGSPYFSLPRVRISRGVTEVAMLPVPTKAKY